MDKFYKIGNVIMSESVLRGHSIIDTDGQFIVFTTYKIDAGSPENAKRALDAIARVIGAEDLLAPDHDSKNWIPWPGGSCPADEGVTVAYRQRDGYEGFCNAGNLLWVHDGEDYDIVAYRLMEK